MLVQYHLTVMKKNCLIDNFVQKTIEMPYWNQIIPTNTKKPYFFLC